MKRSIMGASALALLVLAGCAQKPAPEAGFKSQSAASYFATPIVRRMNSSLSRVKCGPYPSARVPIPCRESA